jgi:uncharacterized protein (DUF1778 family)
MTNKDMKPIDPSEVTVLKPEDFDAFQAALAAPPEPTLALRAAFARSRKILSETDEKS